MRVTVLFFLIVLAFCRNSLWNQGTALWKDAAAKSENRGRVYINLGSSLVDDGAYFEAVQAFREGMVKGLSDELTSYTLYNLGLLYQKMGEYAKAEEYYGRAISTDSRNVHAHNNLGILLLGRGDVSAAEKELTAARRAQSYASLGIVYELQGRTRDAEEAYRNALRMNPFLKNLKYSFGGFLMRTGRRGEALRYFREAIDDDPQNALALNSLGNALWEDDRVDEAVSYLKRAVDVDKSLAPAHNNLGLAYQRRGQAGDAIKEITRAIELSPGFAEYHVNLGAVLYSEGREKDAVTEFRKALSLMPCSSWAHHNMGTVYQDKKKYLSAVSEYEKAVQCDPKYYKAYYSLGKCYMEMGEKENAVRAFRKILKIVPDFSPALEELVKAGGINPTALSQRK